MLKRHLSLLLSLIMILTAVMAAPVFSSAATADMAASGATEDIVETGATADVAETGYFIPSETAFATRLAQLREIYPSYGYSGVYYEDGMAKAWTCYGYTCIMLYEVFGIKYYADGFLNQIDYSMGDICAGDIVRIFGSHSIFITKVTARGYYFTDANWDNANGVRWNAYYTKAEMEAIFTYKVHVPGNTLRGNGTARTGLYADTPVLSNTVCSEPGITISWEPVADAESYRVFYKGGDQKTWKTIGNTQNTEFTLTKNLVYGTEYSFTVRCLDCYGELISGYDREGISAKYFVSAPQLTSAKAGVDKVTLKWAPVDTVTKYRVFAKSAADTHWRIVGNVTGTAFNYTKGQAHTTYQFTVRCLNRNNELISGCSPRTLTANYVTYATQHAAPEITSITATTAKNTARITWNPVSGANRYYVFVSKFGVNAGWKIIGITTKNYFNYTACTNNTAFRFTVRCADAKGNFTSDFKRSDVFRYYNAPEKLKAVKADDDGNVKLSWGAVKGVSSYMIYYKTDLTSWNRVFDTAVAGTSCMIPNCVSGIKYTFTVRACDANGKIVSSYDPTGVSLIYKANPKPTEAVTEPVTEVVTEALTEPASEFSTEAVTEPASEPATEPVTEPVTESVTEATIGQN